ncbi:hypothetical protein [Streptomyces acidiscabies]|uniref:hypothetical protein n=1 Tax=Streptomyces acidiscabies TaxID=42234 RepID=UPI0038F68DB0
MRKLISLRSAVILGVSGLVGVQVSGDLGTPGGWVAGVVGVWVAERLDRMVGE